MAGVSADVSNNLSVALRINQIINHKWNFWLCFKNTVRLVNETALFEYILEYIPDIPDPL